MKELLDFTREETYTAIRILRSARNIAKVRGINMREFTEIERLIEIAHFDIIRISENKS